MFKNVLIAMMKIRCPLITCKRKPHTGKLPKKVLPYKDFMRFNDHRLLLKNTLGIQTMDAVNILLKKPEILNLSHEYLVRQCKLLLKWNYDPKSLVEDPTPLLVSGTTVENVAMLLKDMGAQLEHPRLSESFEKAMRLPMYTFKAYVKIPQDDVVAKNLLKCIKQPEEGVEPLTIPEDDLSVNKYHKHCLQWYIKWKLNVSEENRLEMKRMLSSLRLRSFTIMEQLFEICRNEIGLSVEEMKKHRCLQNGSPSNLRQIIDEEEIFYGREMKKLLKMDPRLCRMDYGNAIEVIKLLEKHDVTEMAIKCYPRILLENASDLAFKLQAIDASPETRFLKNNVRSIDMMINDFNKSQIRLSYLRYLNIKFATVRLLSSELKPFEKFLARGSDRTRSNEIGHSFEKVLNMKPDVLLAKLQKHPYWNHVDLVSMHDTADFLKEQGFGIKDIKENIPILLYPREKIAKALETLGQHRPKQEKGQKREKRTWTERQTLALCLYEIEREFHFSNDGIWREENLVPRRSSKRVKTSADDNDSSDEMGGKEEISEKS